MLSRAGGSDYFSNFLSGGCNLRILYSVIYDSGSVPEKRIFFPRGTAPVYH